MLGCACLVLENLRQRQCSVVVIGFHRRSPMGEAISGGVLKEMSRCQILLIGRCRNASVHQLLKENFWTRAFIAGLPGL